MFLLDLPAILVEDILLEAARTGNMYEICRLREVNKFFESVVTRAIADFWFCKLFSREPQAMDETFRRHLVKLFLGDCDRKLNGLHSYLHSVCDYLAQYSECALDMGYNYAYWLAQVGNSLNRCSLYDSSMDPLRLSGYSSSSAQWHSTRQDDKDVRADLETPSLSELLASAFMIAVITDNEQLQTRMLVDNLFPTAQCPYLGYPFDMACRLGLINTISRLISAGAKDCVEFRCWPRALFYAVRSNQAQVVRLLLESPFANKYTAYHLAVAGQEAARQRNLNILEMIFNINPSEGRWFAIEAAAANGWDDLLNHIIASGLYDAEMFWKVPNLPMLCAAEGGHLSTCEILLKVTCPRWIKRSLKLTRRIAIGGNVKILELSLSIGTRDDHLRIVPVIAARHGKIEMLKYALNRGYHLQDPEPEGTHIFAFATAISHQHYTMAEFLIQHFSLDVNMALAQLDKYSISPLLLAVDSGSVSIVQLLTQHGASSDSIAWNAIGFSRQDRVERHSLLMEKLTQNIGFSYFRLSWEYDVHQRKVDRALSAVVHGPLLSK